MTRRPAGGRPPIVAYIDGGSRGNPGPAGYGVSIETSDGDIIDQLVGALGVATNNHAEYEGLIAALDYLVAHAHPTAVIRSDSQLLVRQMRGEYRVRHPALRVLHRRATDLALGLTAVTYEHVPREQNRRADALANRAMDGKGAIPPPGADDAAAIPPPAADDAAAAIPPPGADDAADHDGAAALAPAPGVPRLPTGTPRSGIVGIGIDIEEVPRVAALVARYGDRFLSRVFTDAEVAYCRRRRFPAQHLAGRFSAKEAAMKALGTGRARGVRWIDVEVVRRSGPPRLALRGGARRRLEALDAAAALVSITHTRALAMAQVVLVRK